MLRRIAANDAEVAARYFLGADPDGEPRWTARLVAHLVTAPYTTHVRQLEASLWQAMLHGDADVLDLPAVTTAPAHLPVPDAGDDTGERERPPGEPAPIDPRTRGAEDVRRALAASGGVQERAWRALGLRSRYQLIRLMRKHGLGSDDARADDGGSP